MTIKYLIREDGIIAEWHPGIKDFTGLKPYEFPIETEVIVPKKKNKGKIDGDPDSGSSEQG